MFERFTDRARKVMALANQEAQRFNHEYIGTEHILLGVVKEGSGVGANVLKNLDIDLRKVRLEVEKRVRKGPETAAMGKLPQTPRAKKVIEGAIAEARDLNHNYVGTEHLLLGLLRDPDSVAAQVLVGLDVSSENMREELVSLLGEGKTTVSPETMSHLQQVVSQLDSKIVAPFSFRFSDRESRYELLDSDGNVVDSQTLGGPVGAYLYNAMRKHEAIQKLLRDCREVIHNEAGNCNDPVFVNLVTRIDRMLD